MNKNNEIMTVKEVAEYLRVCANTVRSMAKFGRIPPKAIVKYPGARKWRFKRDEIIKWAQYDPPRERHARP